MPANALMARGNADPRRILVRSIGRVLIEARCATSPAKTTSTAPITITPPTTVPTPSVDPTACATPTATNRISRPTACGEAASRCSDVAAAPNVTVLETVGNIEEALSRSRLLLMPSLWYEGFGLIVMEAMLRGLPVISSDSGGLVEAKQGTGFVVPVRPIEHYESVFDENHMPKPVDVTQDIEPWERALATLTGNPGIYSAEAEASRRAALRFVSALRASQFEEMLRELPPAEAPATAEPRHLLESLSPARRALLLQRLRERSSK